MVSKVSDKRIVEQTSCPSCNSSDAFTIYEKDGKLDGHCFSCKHFTDDPYGSGEVVTAMLTKSPKKTKPKTAGMLVELGEGILYPVPKTGIPSRKISNATCERYGVRVGVSTEDGLTPLFTLFPRYRSDNLTGWKTVDKYKNIVSTGGSNADPFGLQTIKPKGKKLWITEGEYDAMSVYQALKEGSSLDGWEPDVISIPDGVGSASSSLSRHYDKLVAYDEIILVFDNDEVGRAGRDEVLKLFSGKSCYVDIPSPYKDANDMLQAGKATDLKWLCLTGYKKYKPDNVVNASDMWEKYNDKSKQQSYPYPPTMPILNEKTYGVRDGSIVTVTSGTGSGKSQFMRELMYHFHKTTDHRIAGLFLEEGVTETLKGLVALDLNKRITLPDVIVSEEDEKESFDRLFSSGRITLLDYFGGLSDDSLLSSLRYFAATGNKFIFLDHLSIVVSEFAAQGNERERIDTIMTKLAKFVKETGVILFLVVHLRKNTESGKSFEEGARPSLDDLRGSGSLKQLSWEVIGLSRNQQHEDEECANTIELSCLKSRFTGRTGIADYLKFSQKTGRMYNTTKPANYHPIKGKKYDIS